MQTSWRLRTALALALAGAAAVIGARQPVASAATLLAIDFSGSTTDGDQTTVTTGSLTPSAADATLLSGQLTRTFTFDNGSATESFVVDVSVTVDSDALKGPVVSASGTIGGVQVGDIYEGCGRPTLSYSGPITGGTYSNPASASGGTLFLTGTLIGSYSSWDVWTDDLGIKHCDPVTEASTHTGIIAVLQGVHSTGLTVAVGDASVQEGGSGSITPLSFAVTLSAPAPAAGVTVSYGTSDVTTQAGTDYVVASGTLTFTAGQAAKTVVVTVNGDNDAEPDEKLTLTLSSATGATIADSAGTGTIFNDDAAVAFDWRMPDRFGLDANADGLTDYFTTAAAISPSRWRVDFTYTIGGVCDGALLLTIRIDGATIGLSDPFLVALNTANCTFSYAFPAERKYVVTLELSRAGGLSAGQATHDVIVQDWLIVSLGDSVASGEGNPDIAGTTPTWQDRQCHRSALSGPAQAALSLEQLDRHTSVTFVHLACSGASIFRGVTGSYRGQESGPLLPAQVEAMDSLVGNREIDAVLLSVGANDVNFRSIVTGCFLQRNCHVSRRGSMNELFAGEMVSLPSDFDALGLTLRASRYDVMAPRVYITEYYDPTRTTMGNFCHETIFEESGAVPFFGITAEEGQWASTEMLVKLNAAVKAAATRNSWNYIGEEGGISGPYGAFVNRGYCSQDRWIVQLTESLANQGNIDGTMHPNAAGHQFYGAWIAGRVARDFFPSGSSSAPRPPR